MSRTQVETEEEKRARELVEEIACNIAKLSRQVAVLLDGRLKKSSIIILLVGMTKLPKSTVEVVLDAIVGLEDAHLKSSK